jgi:class 3 adenylate cyclase
MKTRTVTIMVIDLVGSTPLVAQVSRQQLVDLLEDVTLPIRRAVAEFGGTVVKFTGDGYLITFESASEALHAAGSMVSAFIAQPTLPTGIRLEGCRIVLHTSDVIIQDNDVIGEGVVTAVRLEKNVPTNEVYLTSTTRDVAKSAEFEFQLVGDFPLKGLANPVKVYRLVTEPLSGIERGVYLTITDLLGMSQFMTTAPIERVNRTILRWISFQREAISHISGRLRSIVGDNLVTTYQDPDDAVEALLRLDQLVREHNANPGDLPTFAFSAVLCKGDLFVLSIGVNGPLVGHAFRLLEQVPAGEKVIESAVHENLRRYRERFVERSPLDSRQVYQLLNG